MSFVLFASVAAAFCGTYVAVGDDAPTNRGSQVAVVLQNERTTLTMANDVLGELSDFAMVIPVPEILAESAIRVVDPTIFDRIEAYSGARLVAYECADFAPTPLRDADADTDTDTDADADYDTGDTQVEGQYVVGEYDVVVLSSTESGSLVSWLQGHGYNVPSESMSLLGEYIDGGSYFVAAQVRTDAGVAAGDTLSPLQLEYSGTSGTLPVRLGTLNSEGVQDLTIFSVTPYGEGAMGIANYPESVIEADCMLPEGETLGGWVDAQIDAALPTTGSARWVNEYTWNNGSCDPCTSAGNLTEVDLASLGFEPEPHYGYRFTFSRLHARYTPEQIDQDLVLYPSGISKNRQLRYISNNPQLEDRFPVCGVGMVQDPGTCAADDLAAAACACDAGGSAGLGFGLLVGAAALRRRPRRA